ncbi:MAG: phospholipid carrier-dependent glycosyltransferase [Chloroflexi bacterium]|nr:phospholipid carrier-dependent glycosyltransferase [Chloroflexota bacterium]
MKKRATIPILTLTFLAFALRLWHVGGMPPGWRDDELINSLVISQHVLDGQWALYYADASGHEALYHVLNAVMLGLFGANWAGIRLLSVFLGTLTVPLTWLLGRKMFNNTVGLLAAAGLTFSFWSLMYSRIGLRHILMPLLTLLAFYFFWRALKPNTQSPNPPISQSPIFQSPISNYLLAALFMGLGFYTYFASRGVPLILLAFTVYLALVDWPLFRRKWRGIGLMFGVTAVLALPLFFTLQQQPESEARVAELAVPLVEARQGNFAPLQQHVVATLGMAHADGDDEWLYNIPHRPVFGPIAATFFWAGVAIAAWYTLKGIVLCVACCILRKRGETARPDGVLFAHDHTAPSRPYPSFPYSLTPSLPFAFLLIWWLVGISPGFISVPPASLGHTILAQSAFFMLAVLPIWRLEIGDWRFAVNGWQPPISNLQSLLATALGVLLLLSIITRDLPDYFVEWPSRGMVRFLYRADIQDVAEYLNDHPEITDVGITSLLAGPWDKVALEIDLDRDTAVSPRWYNPQRAILLNPPLSFRGYPEVAEAYENGFRQVAGGDQAGYYSLAQVEKVRPSGERVCFQNGLCLISANYDPETGRLELGFEVARELELPPNPLISNPPPPGVYSGPRLYAFGQLLDAGGNFLAGDDGLWVDPYSLQPGDVFLQQHWPQLPEGADPVTAVFGLYDPMTGQRILTADGRDHLRLTIGTTDEGG